TPLPPLFQLQQHSLGRSEDRRAVQPVMCKQRFEVSSRAAKSVLNTDADDAARRMLGHSLRDSAAQTADDVMILHRNNAARLFRSAHDFFYINRLDGVAIQHANSNLELSLEPVSREKRLLDHMAGCDDRYILA